MLCHSIPTRTRLFAAARARAMTFATRFPNSSCNCAMSSSRDAKPCPGPAAAHMPVSCVSLCAVLLAGPSSVVAMLAHARGPLRPSPWAARTYRAKMSAGVAVPETFFWDGKLQWDPDGKVTCLIIPDGTKRIWPLEDFAPLGAEGLIQSIIIPDTVTEISRLNFRGCKSLSQITIPNSVVRIEDGAFDGCESLASITVPDSVTHMGDQVFVECTRLADVSLPDSVTRIGANSFLDCHALKTFRMPAAVTEIGMNAFRNCSSLTAIALPPTLTELGTGVFGRCSSLESIVLPGALTRIAPFTFTRCHSLKSITIGNKVKEIQHDAIRFCTSLKTITIPSI